MLPKLDPIEIRILGCLMEKSIVTPDQYPMTQNALTNACNQKTSREPVMSLGKSEILSAIGTLKYKHLLSTAENFKRGVDKYSQRFCNTRYSDVQLEADEFAVVTLLLLRGPQTPGELRARSGRLHTFADNQAVVDTAQRLMNWESGVLITRLARKPGRKDAEFAHLLGESFDAEQSVVEDISAPTPDVSLEPDLEQRVIELEREVQRLADLIAERD